MSERFSFENRAVGGTQRLGCVWVPADLRGSYSQLAISSTDLILFSICSFTYSA